MVRQPHHNYVSPVGPYPEPNKWREPFFEIILIRQGKDYIYASTQGSIQQLIEHLRSLPPHNEHSYLKRISEGRYVNFEWEISWLSKLIGKVVTQKEVRRAIKLKLLIESHNGTIYRTQKRLDKGFHYAAGRRWKWSSRKEGYTLKQESKYKRYRRSIKRGRNPLDGVNPARNQVTWQNYVDPFEGISNNVFGHPRLKKNNLRAKRLRKGYRRAHEKQELIKDE